MSACASNVSSSGSFCGQRADVLARVPRGGDVAGERVAARRDDTHDRRTEVAENARGARAGVVREVDDVDSVQQRLGHGGPVYGRSAL